MKAEISPLGELRLEAESPTEGYALAQWYGNAFEEDKCTVVIRPTFNCALGPQPVLLGVAEETEGEE